MQTSEKVLPLILEVLSVSFPKFSGQVSVEGLGSTNFQGTIEKDIRSGLKLTWACQLKQQVLFHAVFTFKPGRNYISGIFISPGSTLVGKFLTKRRLDVYKSPTYACPSCNIHLEEWELYNHFKAQHPEIKQSICPVHASYTGQFKVETPVDILEHLRVNHPQNEAQMGLESLYCAAREDRLEDVIRILVNENLDLGSGLEWHRGSTVLHGVSYYNRGAMTYIMLRMGCPRDKKNHYGNTAEEDSHGKDQSSKAFAVFSAETALLDKEYKKIAILYCSECR